MIDLFTATPAEREIIERIAKRAVALYRKYGLSLIHISEPTRH